MTLGRSAVSEAQFPHLENGDNNRAPASGGSLPEFSECINIRLLKLPATGTVPVAIVISRDDWVSDFVLFFHFYQILQKRTAPGASCSHSFKDTSPSPPPDTSTPQSGQPLPSGRLIVRITPLFLWASYCSLGSLVP